MPFILLGLIYFLYFSLRWVQKFFFLKNKIRIKKNSNHFFITYLSPYHYDYAKKDEYRSKSINNLHDYINSSRKKVNWLLIYSPETKISFFKSLSFLSKVNSNKNLNEFQSFFFIEHCLSFLDLTKILFLYFRHYCKFLVLSQLKKKFYLKNSTFSFYKILRYNFNSSLYGPSLMRSCINTIAFQKIFKQLKQKNTNLDQQIGLLILL